MSTLDVTKPLTTLPAQEQAHQPGSEKAMTPAPRSFMQNYKSARRLSGKNVLITGGDSGIGRATAIGCAKEGADVAIVYLEETEDALETKRHIEATGQKCLLLAGDISEPATCEKIVEQTARELGGLNILINNAAEQHPAKDIREIDAEQIQRTFAVNVFSMFYLTQAALKYLKAGDSIINTASITAYRGSKRLMDYSATKGAIVAFTRSLSENLADKGIRVNAVAPGPIWTPLIPASFTAEEVAEFGKDTTLKRPGQPDEVAPCFIFLASDDASYMTGQVLHPNGGTVVNT